MRLLKHQLKALPKIHDGCILCGGVGSGKSITALSYFYLENGGDLNSLTGGKFRKLENPCGLYIITTARKRDDKEWDMEAARFLLETNSESHTLVIDSWNNIKKYVNVQNAFFIFDEQRVVGYGEWTKSFLKIAKQNRWILLSATPADVWTDYIPVFIANGFYRSKSEFNNNHVIFKPYSRYPQVDRYWNVEKLLRLRSKVLVDMEFERSTVRHSIDIICDYDKAIYKAVMRTRKNVDTGLPIKNVSEYCQMLRKVINRDPSRLQHIFDILNEHERVIVFYNYDYELDILKNAEWPEGYEIAEWNGHAHQPTPIGDKWIYLVQYTAGCEGWNCIRTDTIIFYSQTYSYRVLEQSMGRIDRLNTPYHDLYYYHLKSIAPLDIAITRALKNKKRFNETKFMNSIGKGNLYEKVS